MVCVCVFGGGGGGGGGVGQLSGVGEEGGRGTTAPPTFDPPKS